MEIRRFFVNEHDVSNGTAYVSGDEFLHMTKVLRYKVGYKAILCANNGVEHTCTIEEIGKDCATLSVDASVVVDKKKISLTLFAGILKNNKLDFTIQKAVELGVDRIVPFISQNSAESKFSVERANKIALEAAKQCGSAYLTLVDEPLNFSGVIKQIGNFDTVLFAYEFEKKNRIKDCTFDGKNVALIVGCEGGFAKEEMESAKDAGAQVVTLGKRILRAETASIVATTLTLDTLGELDYE